MSDGKKFSKTDSNLTPEQRLEEVERKYSVIQERIQAYDRVLEEFSKISSDLQRNNQSISDILSNLNKLSIDHNEDIDILRSRINEISQFGSKTFASLIEQKKINQELSENIVQNNLSFRNEIYLARDQLKEIKSEYEKQEERLSSMEALLFETRAYLIPYGDDIKHIASEHTSFKTHVNTAINDLGNRVNGLLSSLQELPQFNEWATKIYIKVCNDISEKQKQFYYELDKRSQQLKDQLASDPYTAESVKKILKEEMDVLAIDGKNAYLKATNVAQQIQLLEKKVETINLILKKYELNK